MWGGVNATDVYKFNNMLPEVPSPHWTLGLHYNSTPAEKQKTTLQ